MNIHTVAWGVGLVVVVNILAGIVAETNSTEIDRITDVKTTAQLIFAIVRHQKDGHAGAAADSTKQAQFEAELQKAKPAHNLTESKLREGRHVAAAVKIQDALLRLVNNVSHVEPSHARLLGELVGEISASAPAHFSGQSHKQHNDNGVESTLKSLNKDLENVIVPLGTALARLLVERKSESPPPVVHTEMENGINAAIKQHNLQNQTAYLAHMLANQIHLQEFAVCGHLILNGLIQPYDYLEAVGSGVGEVLAIMNDDNKRATLDTIHQSLEVQIAARIRIALILSGVAHNESLDDGITLLANEIANYTAGDILQLMDRSPELDNARQEMRMASAHFAKSLWNIRILNLGSLVVLRTPPSLISFTFEEDLAGYVPSTWMKFDYVDLEPSLQLYNSRNSAGEVTRKPDAQKTTTAP